MLACSHYWNVSKQTTRISIFIVNTFVSLGCSGKFSRLDLCAFGFSTQRLEQTATCSISTISIVILIDYVLTQFLP
nr:hypothetical protein [Tanacetum cinerariifolium]